MSGQSTEIAALRAAADAIRKSAHVNSPEQAARFLEGRAEALAHVAGAGPDWTQPCPLERRCADRYNLCPPACHEASVFGTPPGASS